MMKTCVDGNQMGKSLSALEQALLEMKTNSFPNPDETDPRLLEALAILNQISNAINHIGSDDASQNDLSLQLIVESAIRVVPGSSAVIYTYDQTTGTFENESSVSSEPDGRKQPEGMDKPDEAPERKSVV